MVVALSNDSPVFMVHHVQQGIGALYVFNRTQIFEAKSRNIVKETEQGQLQT